MKLQKDKNQIVEFQIEVEGTDENIYPRLILKNESIAVIFTGNFKDKKTAIFEISKLNKIFEKSNKINGEIEVIVEDRYFKPWSSEIELENPISVKVIETTIPKIKKPIVKVSEIKQNITAKNKQHIKTGKTTKIKLGNKLQEVLITKIINENEKYSNVMIVDQNGKRKRIKIKRA